MPPVYYPTTNTSEVTFTVLNKNRVIPGVGEKGEGTVNMRFETNELVNEEDRYLLQLKFKENVLAEKELSFKKS